ncbi:MAG: GxxExxY protein [Candidatus Hydrogenedentales bacterium]|jgi:GxxExxY protein
MQFDPLSNRVIGCAIEVHRALGPGLLESVYQHCLAHELASQQIACLAEHPLPVEYKGRLIDCGYRLDLLIEDALIVELKSVDRLLPIHEAQILTYMKLAKIRTRLLINFNAVMLRDGLKRFVL